MSGTDAVSIASLIALVFLNIALLLSAVRIVIGPTIADRVLALDLLTVLAVSFVGALAVYTGLTLYLDIAIALGLLGFLATVAFARYILVKSGHRDAAANQESPP